MTLPSDNFSPKFSSPITTLTTGIASDATEITLTEISYIPSEPNILVIWDDTNREIVHYSATPVGSVVTIERGYGDSTACAFEAGAYVSRLVSYLGYKELTR